MTGGLGAQRANPVYGTRYRHLTGRDTNKLTPTQAQTAIAAAILRHLNAVITTGQVWDPVVAAHGIRYRQAPWPPNDEPLHKLAGDRQLRVGHRHLTL